MKQTGTITIRDAQSGEALEAAKGWEAEVHGVPVALVDRSPRRRSWAKVWVVYELRTGCPIMGGRPKATREEALEAAALMVERTAENYNRTPREHLEQVVTETLGKWQQREGEGN